MKVNRRFCHGLVLMLVLQAVIVPPVNAWALQGNSAPIFSSINFVSNIETIGIVVTGTQLPQTADLFYRQVGDTTWHAGQPLFRSADGRLIGSLFNLSPATSYEVRVVTGASEGIGTATTQPDQLGFTPSVILHVDDSALPGGDGSAAAPYKTIQEAVNHAGPGTQVLVDDGTYREAVTFPGSGTAGKWIQVKAEGNAAVLDSADRLSGNIWTQTSTSKVWFTKLTGPVAYLARSGTRFYQYKDLAGLKQAKGWDGTSSVQEGWFYEAGTSRLYIRSLDSPSAHLWQLPRLNYAFEIGAQDWLWIEGFEIRFYGKSTGGCGVCTMNASHLVIRRNKIHNMQLGIFINWNGSSTRGNDTRIEGNEIYDPGVYGLPWAALKASPMEGSGIIVRGHVGAIVRGNTVYSYFNGIYTGVSGTQDHNPEVAFDADIYKNHMYNISDDGLEPEGACINHRFRNNTVDKSFIGISIAPVTWGPTWVLRNTFSGFTGRGIKFADSSAGIVLIYHNTAWSTVSSINAADLITSIHNVKMRNNIFQSAGYSINEVPTGSTAIDWNNDNWYTTRGSSGPHFKWEKVDYNTIAALCAASGLECKGYETPPGFTNPAGHDFTLLSSSPNIDRGILITGINDDFNGKAPDVGAYESGSSSATTFVDVPTTHPYYQDIEILYANNLTGGCNTSPPMFCPDQIMDRAQSAAFLLRANFGPGYVPHPAEYLFQDDWSKGLWARDWAEAMREAGMTAGCKASPLLYCPWVQLPREQVVIFALKMKYGDTYKPPAAAGSVFADMTDPNYYATAWAEQAYKDGLMPACGTSGDKPLFCPRELVTRGLGAYVIVRAKNLSMP